MSRGIDMTGMTFNRLTGVERVGSDAKRKPIWLFRCECGATTKATGANVRQGRVKSCGCAALDATRARNVAAARHGMCDTPTYRSWTAMKERCQRPTHHKYALYGGRGITVCERWNDFTNFLADMGPRPEGMTLDRIDVNDGYRPGNCRWATAVEQRHNQRRAA